ncbi:MAG: putative (di)nucleoside polyphosphate hydrolase, partial [Ilumatobacteraceae bacterium]
MAGVSGQHFRAGVVIVVRHPDLHQVLAFERSDLRGSWQLPQGGLESGEEPVTAAWRELEE